MTYLVLDALDLSGCSFHAPSEKFIFASEIALQGLVDDLKEYDFDWLLDWMKLDRDDTHFLGMRKFAASIMACALHCDLNWIIQQFADNELWQESMREEK